ncbi:immunity 49 family protein [Alteromonas ponticola]|uniref:Immunity 49 family protein n=1 Tax=Alteromonas aquimaris TaxID=2998417 RepID=A0ABT3P2Q5_9ALTE|nr:Imm49 family immunity protein [Alteromonas aquimaris]MCW8107043.1 immunity 49 family protein [Alteromonas aquimaris]
MRSIHIKNFVPEPKDLERTIEYLRNGEPERNKAGLKNLLERKDEDFAFIIWEIYNMERHRTFSLLQLYDYSHDKSDFTDAMQHLKTSFNALEMLMETKNIFNTTSQEVTVMGISGKLHPRKGPLNRLAWARYIFESISMRRPDLVERHMQFDPEEAAQAEPKSADMARFYVEYIKGMLTPDAQHERLLRQYTEVFAPELHPRARVALQPLYYVAIGDEVNYEKSMRVAGKAHHKAAMSNHIPFGIDQMAYPSDLIATASLAYDRHGWMLKHTNDYLPEWWIYNRFAPAS